MINVAIVDDEKNTLDELSSYFEDYSRGGQQFHVVTFDNPIDFLTDYKANYDLVLMDIDMPNMNGMDAARRLRAVDKSTTLIFVTNMAQFAVEGYEVNAFDYIVKPVSPCDFKLKLDRIVEHIKAESDIKIKVTTGYSVKVFAPREVLYIEVTGHKIIYHTTEGVFSSTGTLRDLEQKLVSAGFTKCNNCYLVNLRHVKGVDGLTVNVAGDALQISYPKRKEFIRALNDYLGSGGGVH